MKHDIVRFVMELQDYKAMTAHICAPATKRSKTMSVALSVAGVLTALLVATRYVESLMSFTLGMFVFSVLMFAIIKVAASGIRAQLHPSPDGTILCEYEVTLTPDGVSIQTRHWDTLTRWSGVRSIDQTAEHAFIRIDSIAAYAIPKRAFPDETAFRSFVERGQAYITH